MRILLVGAGGHGRVVADILGAEARAGKSVRIAGYVDDEPSIQGQCFIGGRVLARVGERRRLHYDALIVAIGDNVTRRVLFRGFEADGERFAIGTHPSAVLAENVSVGAGTVICAGVIVNTGSRVGRNVILNTGCTVDHDTMVADHVHVAPGVHMGGQVSIGEGALLGIGAVVLPGLAVGARSIVGAGAVVTRDVPEDAKVTGLPARLRRPRIPLGRG